MAFGQKNLSKRKYFNWPSAEIFSAKDSQGQARFSWPSAKMISIRENLVWFEKNISEKWFFTPSFALGYYDRGDSKDLGYNLEFRSQIEFSYKLKSSRIGFNLNHISNASIGDTNPGTESATISLIRPF